MSKQHGESSYEETGTADMEQGIEESEASSPHKSSCVLSEQREGLAVAARDSRQRFQAMHDEKPPMQPHHHDSTRRLGTDCEESNNEGCESAGSDVAHDSVQDGHLLDAACASALAKKAPLNAGAKAALKRMTQTILDQAMYFEGRTADLEKQRADLSVVLDEQVDNWEQCHSDSGEDLRAMMGHARISESLARLAQPTIVAMTSPEGRHGGSPSMVHVQVDTSISPYAVGAKRRQARLGSAFDIQGQKGDPNARRVKSPAWEEWPVTPAQLPELNSAQPKDSGNAQDLSVQAVCAQSAQDVLTCNDEFVLASADPLLISDVKINICDGKIPLTTSTTMKASMVAFEHLRAQLLETVESSVTRVHKLRADDGMLVRKTPRQLAPEAGGAADDEDGQALAVERSDGGDVTKAEIGQTAAAGGNGGRVGEGATRAVDSVLEAGDEGPRADAAAVDQEGAAVLRPTPLAAAADQHPSSSASTPRPPSPVSCADPPIPVSAATGSREEEVAMRPSIGADDEGGMDNGEDAAGMEDMLVGSKSSSGKESGNPAVNRGPGGAVGEAAPKQLAPEAGGAADDEDGQALAVERSDGGDVTKAEIGQTDGFVSGSAIESCNATSHHGPRDSLVVSPPPSLEHVDTQSLPNVDLELFSAAVSDSSVLSVPLKGYQDAKAVENVNTNDQSGGLDERSGFQAARLLLPAQAFSWVASASEKLHNFCERLPQIVTPSHLFRPRKLRPEVKQLLEQCHGISIRNIP